MNKIWHIVAIVVIITIASAIYAYNMVSISNERQRDLSATIVIKGNASSMTMHINKTVYGTKKDAAAEMGNAFGLVCGITDNYGGSYSGEILGMFTHKIKITLPYNFDEAVDKITSALKDKGWNVEVW